MSLYPAFSSFSMTHLATPADAPGREHGDVRAHGVHHVGDQHHGRDLAAVAARLGALRDEDVDPPLDVALGVAGAAAEGADQHAVGVSSLDDIRRGRAEGVDDHRHRVLEHDIDLARALDLDGQARGLQHALVPVGEGRHAVLLEQVLDVPAVLFGDGRLEAVEIEVLALAHELLGHGEVHAVGLAADVGVDPGQLDLELVGAVGEGPENAVATGLAHGGDDVSAVGEREQRELDAEALGDGRAHPLTLPRPGTVGQWPPRNTPLAGCISAWRWSTRSPTSPRSPGRPPPR